MSIAVVSRPSPSRALGLGLILLAPGALFLLANILNELGISVVYDLVDALMSKPRLRFC